MADNDYIQSQLNDIRVDLAKLPEVLRSTFATNDRVDLLADKFEKHLESNRNFKHLTFRIFVWVLRLALVILIGEKWGTGLIQSWGISLF